MNPKRPLRLVRPPAQTYRLRSVLLVLLLVVLVPTLVLQGWIGWRAVEQQRLDDRASNVEAARAVSALFQGFVSDLGRQMGALGLALEELDDLPAIDLNRVLAQQAREYPSVNNLLWVDVRGRVLASSDPRLAGTDIHDRTYFQQAAAAESGQWVVGNLIQSRVSGRTIFVVARPIYRDGMLHGVMAASVEAEGLGKRVLRMKRPRGGTMLLFDRTGRLAYRAPEVPLAWEQRAPERWGDETLAAALAGREGSGAYVSPVDGESRTIAHAPVGTTGWAAGAGRTRPSSAAVLWRSFRTAAGLNLLVLLGSLAAALLVSRRLTHGLHLLREHIERSDDASPPPPGAEYRVEEFRDLATAFDTVTAHRRAAEARFRSVFEQAAVGIGRVSFDDARWMDANDALCNMVGYSREEMRRTPWPQITHPEDVDRDLVPFRRMAAGEINSYTVEKRFIHRQGRHVWARLTLSLVRDMHGEPDYEIAIVEDITEHKRADAALREALETNERNLAQLNAVVNQMTEGLVIFDPQGNLIDMNPAALAIHGFDSVESLRRHLGELPEVFELFDLEGNRLPTPDWPIGRVLRGETFDSYEVRVRRPDSGRTWIGSYGGTPVYGRNGEMLLAIVTTRDVTDRKRSEQALRESEQRVRRKLESVLSPEGDLSVLGLRDLIDVPAFQKLMDEFHAVTQIPMSIIDTAGNVLVGVGWQDICTKFHRAQPDSLRHCHESDTELSAGVPEGEYRLYKCKNNLWDIATPIVVAGQHLGNIFSGQFFFEGEEIDRDVFRAQAREYGFDEEQYLAALDRVPRLPRETIDHGMAFFLRLAEMLSQLGYSNVKLARLLAERERLTESLREAHQRAEWMARFPLENPNPVVRASAEGRVLFFNAAAAQLPGWECKLDQPLPPSLLALVRSGAQSGGPLHQDVELGSRAYTVSVTFLPAEGYCNLYGRDVTDRVHAEHALRESESFHRQALESIPGMVFTTRPDGYCDYQSQQWVEYTGVPMGEHLGEGWNRLLHPDDRERAREAWQAAVAGRAPYDLEYRVRRHDGAYEWFKVRGEPIRDAAGRIVRWFGVAFNIDALKLAEDALLESRQRYRNMFQNNHAAMLLVDPSDGSIVDANPAATGFYGYPQERLREMSIHDLNALPPTAVRIDMAQARDGTRGRFEFPHRLASGEIRQVEVYSGPVPVGGRTLLYSIIHDVTERKEAEERLRETAGELQRSNEDLEQFAYIASHDLQEPLRMVTGYMDLLKEMYGERLDEEGQMFVHFATDGAQRMQQLIQGLLEYSRVTSRARPPEPVPLEEAFDIALANLRAVIRDSGACVTHDALPVVLGDPTQMVQLLQNLLANAVKFRRDGVAPRVHVRADRDGPWWRLSVSDNGIGIDGRHAERIFLIFQRLHAREQYEGRGIGLAVCKKIAERHGGRIWFDSTVGEGTTFHVTLPLAPEPAP